MSSPELMRQDNYALVLATIKAQGQISRVELARLLDLNPATITRITRLLINEGLIKIDGEDKRNGAGRKRVLLSFNHRTRLVIGLFVERQAVTGVIADLAGNILARRAALLTAPLSTRLLIALAEDLLSDNPGYRQLLSVVCVAAEDPSRIDTAGLAEQLELPVVSEHAAALAAAAEASTDAMQECDSFALFYLGRQSFSCTYLNGETRIGSLGLGPDGAPLAERVCDAGLLRHMGGEARTSARMVFEEARAGDPAALAAVEAAAADIAYAARWLANGLSLDRVCIAGPWGRAADVLGPAINAWLEAAGDGALSITFAAWGTDSPLVGAVRRATAAAEATV